MEILTVNQKPKLNKRISDASEAAEGSSRDSPHRNCLKYYAKKIDVNKKNSYEAFQTEEMIIKDLVRKIEKNKQLRNDYKTSKKNTFIKSE